jgi:uncharacterized protein
MTDIQEGRNRGQTRSRGFASMDQAKQREIASKGGQAAHRKGVAHEFSPEEARIAGRKGGQVAHERGTAHQFSSEEARIAGRKGGQASHQKNMAQRSATEEAEAHFVEAKDDRSGHNDELHHENEYAQIDDQ